MCIIMQRDPNFIIDKEAWDTAVLNNPDGWGISVADGNGALTTLRSHECADDELYKLIHDEFLEDHVMIHLRFTTAGATTLRNAHPFPILEQATDGVDLRMAHNGTLSKYKPAVNSPNSWESDTRVFVRQFVRPLFKRLIRGYNIEEILSDPFVYDMLNDKLSALSVLSFIDGFGNTLQVNGTGNGGKYTEGLWYSNEYSFDPMHRTSTTSYGTNWGRSGWGYGDDGYDDWRLDPNKSAPGNASTTPTTGTSSTGSGAGVGSDIGKDMKQEMFTEKYELEVEDLFDLTDDTVDVMVMDDPSMSAMLIKELLARLKTSMDDTKKAIEKHAKAEKACEQLAFKLRKETQDDAA